MNRYWAPSLTTGVRKPIRGNCSSALAMGKFIPPTPKNPVLAASVHFAVEINDWDEMISHLDSSGVRYTRTPGSRREEDAGCSWGLRDYSGGHYTYIHDPDRNMIELVHHPLGLEDADGNKLELTHHAESPSWSKNPEHSKEFSPVA